jgi:hypothetical protein
MESFKQWFGVLIFILLICILIASKFVVRVPHPGAKDPTLQTLIDWLQERDPNLFKRCKVSFDQDFLGRKISRTQEGIYTKITAVLCGGGATFWVNNPSNTVDCYTSYCGQHIGNKYCGEEIAEDLCKQ